MNAEKQRIAIAEACGWLECRPATCRAGAFTGIPPASVEPSRIRTWIPDYLTDLNAMHEAEMVLTDEQQSDYGERLASLVPYNGRSVHRDIFRMAHATAAQRAEAFLRTIGKWEESE